VAERAGKTVLVIGSGGREHALSVRLPESESVDEVVVAPGNAGTARGHGKKRLRNALGDPLSVARDVRPGLVVVGPEAPLCDGLADRLQREGFTVFGPSAAAARLEGSKAFMKDFARRMGMLTARHEVVTDASLAERAVKSFREPPVVKADGLCAGKGVVVAASHDEALAAARSMLSGEAFGDAGRTVVIEERIAGVEASAHAICDGERVFLLPAAQDHKRIGDGDTGPNTGGMGTIAPSQLVSDSMAERIRRDVFERAVQGMAAEGHPFRGVLFAGLMIDAAGEPHLLEFNVRFGDPETQVLMNVIDGDLGVALESAARGTLDPGAISVSRRHALCVVLAAAGYPGVPRGGDVITGLDTLPREDGVRVYHAGTRLDGDRVVTSGGRVLGVVGSGDSLREAHERAYRAVGAIHFEGLQFRRDIGARSL
jgi:phosphoribosylamine--glycine ligase